MQDGPILYDLKWLKASSEVDERLNIARSADEMIVSDEGVHQRVGQLINHHPFFPVQRELHTRLFRARPNDKGVQFNKVSDLWYPPKPNTPLGRFNRPNQPRLYLSGSGANAVIEVGLIEKQHYTIAEYVFATAPACQMIGMRQSNSHILRELNIDLSGRSGHPALNIIRSRPKTAQAFDKIEDYFEKLATRYCSRGKEHRLYRPSAALAEMLFNRKELDGLMYPARKSMYCSTNYCISSEFTDNHAQIVKLWQIELFRFTKTDREGYLLWALRGCSDVISEDGTIDWRCFPKHSSVLNELHDLGFEERPEELAYGPYAGPDGYTKLLEQLERED